MEGVEGFTLRGIVSEDTSLRGEAPPVGAILGSEEYTPRLPELAMAFGDGALSVR
jgi:hypothetical protein